MQPPTVPDWCAWHVGSRPVVVVAPHGGRRAEFAPSSRRPLKVNDLHTTTLAQELALSIDASYVVNTALDRNEIDLNRISQVLRAAPWLLQLLESMLAAILARHRSAEILFVHGWNVVQAKCDIGIGAALADEGQARRHEPSLTASPDYVATRLAAFRAACENAGVHATYGERYPARHHDNLLQIFRRSPPGVHGWPTKRWSDWVRGGRLDAVQLELGVPLRWPGEEREGFLAAARAAFGPGTERTAETPPRAAIEGPLDAPPHSVQLYDPDADIALISSISFSPERRWIGSRLLVLHDGRRVSLFIGEDRSGAAGTNGGPRFATDGSILRLAFEGCLLDLDDAELYLDVEHAFAASRLLRAGVDLTFRPAGSPRYRRVEGTITLGGRTVKIATFAFADSSMQQRPSDVGRSELLLSASFGPRLGYLLRAGRGSERVYAIDADGEREQRLQAMRVDLADDRATPRRFEMRFDDGGVLRGEPQSRVAIQRPLPGGRAARTTFGVARFRSPDGASGFGFYDYSCVARAR